ncbi:MAG TPA: type II toxin-antitoxin system HicB family antitoxin [Candidatus Nanoarchaeia archaeon]|nr:type II toxin-antitoxin system HicB family antitoxin [Candidatus Nanoarchaeia archaeon]
MVYHLSAVVSKDEDMFVARGLEIEIASQGETVEEALSNLKEAFELWLEHAEPSELSVFKNQAPIITQVTA